MTQRWKLIIEYDGTDFVGWQRQKEGYSVQQVIEESIFKLSGEKPTLHVAGRTDAGVHALAQVAHFDLQKTFSATAVRNALNVHSRPHKLSILSAEAVGQDFHARFDAKKRHYRYVILNRLAPPAVDAAYVWHVPHRLNLDHMRQAASYLIGEHDFTSFRAVRCQAKSPIRTIDKLELIQDGDRLYIDISAKSFLHHQVRNIVGTLKKIGKGKWPPEYMKEILEAKDRAMGGETCPPQGLFFLRVDYTDNGNK